MLPTFVLKDKFMEEIKEKTRHFGGSLFVHVDKIKRPIEDRMNRNFEKKHLKAYLKGEPYFSFGFNFKHEPIYFVTKPVWK
jgi:hypothetical protein